MNKYTPEEVLDSILFYDLWNNRMIERLEDDGWKIGYETPEFVLRDPAGAIHNLRVTFVTGTLTDAEIQQHADEGEWNIDDEDY